MARCFKRPVSVTQKNADHLAADAADDDIRFVVPVEITHFQDVQSHFEAERQVGGGRESAIAAAKQDRTIRDDIIMVIGVRIEIYDGKGLSLRFKYRCGLESAIAVAETEDERRSGCGTGRSVRHDEIEFAVLIKIAQPDVARHF